MERISIFNYEAYYLDYLEGKLSEEDTSLLFAFLEQHPECKLDDDELASLTTEDFTLEESFKQNLKQVDEDDAVGLINLDHFLIAQAEGQLETSKERELEEFIAANDLHQEKRLIVATYFDKNEQLIYADKEGLKQAATVRLWPYVAAAASVLIIMMIYLFGGQADMIEPTQNILANDQQESMNKTENSVTPEVNNESETGSTDVTNYAVESTTKKEIKDPVLYNNSPVSQEEEIALANAPVRRILSPKVSLNPEPLSQQLVSHTPTNEEPQNQDYASLHFNGMNNPIKPITKVLSEKTNREIDFRSGKSKTDDSKGFFVKIGKFELSRKKH